MVTETELSIVLDLENLRDDTKAKINSDCSRLHRYQPFPFFPFQRSPNNPLNRTIAISWPLGYWYWLYYVFLEVSRLLLTHTGFSSLLLKSRKSLKSSCSVYTNPCLHKSWTALTWHIWMKTAFKTKYMDSKYFLPSIMRI